jgi:hypothetical protein
VKLIAIHEVALRCNETLFSPLPVQKSHFYANIPACAFHRLFYLRIQKNVKKLAVNKKSSKQFLRNIVE